MALRPVRDWDFERAIFDPRDPSLIGLDPALRQWLEDNEIMPVAGSSGTPREDLATAIRRAFGAAALAQPGRTPPKAQPRLADRYPPARLRPVYAACPMDRRPPPSFLRFF